MRALVAMLVLLGGMRSAAAQPDPLAACADEAVTALSGQGARLLGTRVGFMREGQSRSEIVEIESDGCIGFLAVGHRLVQDLDILLHTESGIALGEDVAIDAHPYLRFCGARGLRLVVTVRMYKGRGEYRLLRFASAPAALPDLNRAVGACFAEGIGLSHPLADVGPEPGGWDAAAAMRVAIGALAGLGYRPIGEERRGALGPRDAVSEAIAIPAAGCYGVVAVGGQGVSDLDLYVRGADGRPLARDVARSRDALVRFCADAPGEYLADVRMYEGAGDWVLRAFRLDEPEAGERPTGLSGGSRIPYAELLSRIRARGLVPRAHAWGILSPGQQLSMPVALSAGHCYAMGGVPEDTLLAGDLDIVVVDDSGALLAWEVSADPQPLVFHCADRTGTVRVLGRAFGARGRYLLVLGEEP